ncbi:MAG: hypothetical protein E7Z92_02205 [Cyanobacteria bacterium SIG31]|nr:hypothetical protein [Cyanobacteria bacterium SIG31]
MEMQLYGGTSFNSTAPSYSNNYYLQSNYLNPYYGAYNPSFYGYNNQSFYGYPNNNAIFGQNIPQGYVQAAQTQQQTEAPQVQQQVPATPFEGLNKAEVTAITEDYAKSLSPSHSFKSAAISGGIGFALMNNPRLYVHPINTYKALSQTNAAFATVKEAGTALNKLWMEPKNSELLREAWLQHNKALARCESKLGLFRKSYLASGDNKVIKDVVLKLEEALKDGNLNEIKKYTAQLKVAYQSNPGILPKGVNYLKKSIGLNVGATSVKEALADEKAINAVIKELNGGEIVGFKNMLSKNTGGFFGPMMWVGFEFLADSGKIQTAFQEDKQTGWKQVGQTAVKGLGSAAGWTLGETAGKWAFAKWGAKIGSKVHPLLGTLIGGAVGLIGGSIGMWLAGKGTKAIVGKDVADKIQVKNMSNSAEGQLTMIQNTIQRIQSGEQVSQPAQQGVQKILAMYA